jgi:pilus assembly protein CpaB
MTHQQRTFAVVGIAVVTASVASYGVYRAIARIPVRNVEIATSWAVVAAKPLPTGANVGKNDVKLVAWPARSPITGGFSNVDDVIDRGLVGSVVENEPLVESKLAPRFAGAGLPPSIPKGMRAMSVKVNEVIGVAGFVVPGTRVDVMVTIRQKDDSLARTVVSNVQVLTAGTRIDQENAQSGKPIPSTVVTLLVAPADAERITLAQAEGQIMLALRNPMDVDPTTTSGVRTAALFGTVPAPSAPAAATKPAMAKRAVVEAVPLPPPPARLIYTVEAIRAAKRTEEVVR